LTGTPHKDLVPAAVFALVLVLLFFFVPALASGVTLLAPAPLLFVYLRHGRRAGLVLMALVFGTLATLLGGGQALQFLGGEAVLAIVLAETVLRGLSFDKSILLGTLGSGLMSLAVLLAVFSGEEGSPVDFFQREIEKHTAQSIETLKSMGESQQKLEAMRQFSEETSRTLASAYPLFVALGALVGAILNYSLVRWLWGRLYGPGLFSPAKFSEWVFPEEFVWGVIASGAVFFFASGMLAILGMNVFFALLAVYFFQGLAVAVHILSARKVPVFWWGLFFFMILLQPLLVGIVAGVGLFDIWADFRKLRPRPQAE